VYLTPTHQWPV